MQKYKFTGETKEVYGCTLHQIVCVTAFASVAAGEVGGYIEKEVNLSQDGNAWVFGDADVFGDAKVSGNAKVSGDAKVFGDAEVCGDAEVFGDAKVSGNAKVCGNAEVCGDAEVCGNAEVRGNAILRRGSTETATDYIVIGPQGSRRSFATLHLPSNTVCTGCFVGDLNEFKVAVSTSHNPNHCDDCKIFNEQYQRVIQVFEFYAKDRQDKDVQ